MKIVIIIAASYMTAPFASSEEFSLGKIQAPVTIIEYGSLTCDYCISFHRNVLPRVKKHYIDTGKVRFTYRHFPTSEAATHGAVAAQCAGEKFYDMLDELYSSVAAWYKSDNKNDIFVEKAISLGLKPETFLSCLSDTENMDNIVNQQRVARKESDVTGTPTFFINGEIVRGKKSFIELKALINKALIKN